VSISSERDSSLRHGSLVRYEDKKKLAWVVAANGYLCGGPGASSLDDFDGQPRGLWMRFDLGELCLLGVWGIPTYLLGHTF